MSTPPTRPPTRPPAAPAATARRVPLVPATTRTGTRPLASPPSVPPARPSAPAVPPRTPPGGPISASAPAALLAGGEELAPPDYAFLSELLARESGLSLAGDKGYLVRTRLGGAASTWGGGTLRGLVAALRGEQARGRAGARPATRAVCDAMTTNETLFFRDRHPFDALRDVILPAAAARRRDGGSPARPVRVWCAAASTGQEPYSVAMCAALAAPRMGGVPVEILATDYSPTALRRAREGVYSEFEVRRGLAPDLAARFFAPAPGGGLRANDALRRLVRYEERNLLEPVTTLGTFDVVLCRNVLLYFDAGAKRDVLGRLADALAPGGLLLLGGTEMPVGVGAKLARAAGVPTPAYQRVGPTT